MAIDVHAHPTLPSWARAANALGHASPDVFAPAQWLEAMDRVGVLATIISSPQGAGIVHGTAARRLARAMNEDAAALIGAHPGRFGALATLPIESLDEAIDELHYAINTLALDGVLLPPTIGGDYLSHERLQPLLAACEDLGAPVLIHPGAARAPTPFEPAFLEASFELTRCIAALAYSGVHRRFPNLTLVASYAGGVAPYLAARFSTFAGSRNVGELSESEVWEGVAALNFDLTLAASEATLAALLQLAPTRQIMFGADTPYESEAGLAGQLAAVRRSRLLDTRGKDDILAATALRLFPRLAKRIRVARGGPHAEQNR